MGLLLLGSALPAVAEVVTVSTKDPRPNIRFQSQVESLQAGDEVRILGAHGEIVADFKLAEFINQGEIGRVFKAINEQGKVVALKLPRNDPKQRVLRFNTNEIKSLMLINENHVPAVHLGRSDAGLFIEKEYIWGETLGETITRWHELSVDEQILRMTELAHFTLTLRNTRLRITDLHTGNIIWDENDKIWKVLDPGSTWQAKSGDASVIRYSYALDQNADEDIKTAFHIAQDQPSWTERYLRLEHAVKRLDILQNAAAIDEFLLSTSPPEKGAIPEYAHLWEEGFAIIRALHARGIRTSLLGCITLQLEQSFGHFR